MHLRDHKFAPMDGILTLFRVQITTQPLPLLLQAGCFRQQSPLQPWQEQKIPFLGVIKEREKNNNNDPTILPTHLCRLSDLIVG